MTRLLIPRFVLSVVYLSIFLVSSQSAQTQDKFIKAKDPVPRYRDPANGVFTLYINPV